MALDSLALIVTVEGAVPLITSPSSVTLTLTVIAVVGAEDAVIVNVADVPSVTGEVPAEMVTSGAFCCCGERGGDAGSSLSFTVTLAEDELPTV